MRGKNLGSFRIAAANFLKMSIMCDLCNIFKMLIMFDYINKILQIAT